MSAPDAYGRTTYEAKSEFTQGLVNLADAALKTAEDAGVPEDQTAYGLILSICAVLETVAHGIDSGGSVEPGSVIVDKVGDMVAAILSGWAFGAYRHVETFSLDGA